MPTTVAGDPTNFPEEITIPSDGDGPGIKAADVNVAFEALADRTAASGDALKAINLATANEPGGTLNWAFFSPKYATWHVIGNTEIGRTSQDMGLAWSSNFLATAGSDEDCLQGAADDNEQAVITTAHTRYVFATVSSAWTKVDCLGTDLFDAEDMGVVYEAESATWCVIASNAAAELMVRLSTDRETWTDATTPPTDLDGVGRVRMAVGDGRIVYANQWDDEINLFYSDDGGDTWTAGQTITLSVTTTECGLSYNATTETFMLTFGEASGAPSSKVYTSDDGVTFTLVATLTNACIVRAAPMRTFWVATVYHVSSGFPCLAYSLDAGVTWKLAGIRL